MAKDGRKVCFVIMGFGKKTDYESGRTLDLDASYETIIKPVTTELGLRCIRADEIAHSGVIDTEMYEMLFRADLVIADISTGNANAMYELGVRHALRPFSTLIMKERDGKLYFDINHTNTFQYKHLGEDIGAREVERAKRELRVLVTEILMGGKPDSPVYTFLPKLQQPIFSDKEFAELLDETESTQKLLARHMKEGEAAAKESRHNDAVVAFSAAAQIKIDEPYILQKLALSTYKSEAPSKFDALLSALRIVEPLDPDHSNDPETLGITGAIRKRLWLLTKDEVQLSVAIRLYGRGFEVRRDYYNGENLALCYDYRAGIQSDPAEVQFDRMSAQKVRVALIGILEDVVKAPSFVERSDRRWVFATLANCLFALGRSDEANRNEVLFQAENPAIWEMETYNEHKIIAMKTGEATDHA